MVSHLNIYVGVRVVCCAIDLKNLEKVEEGRSENNRLEYFVNYALEWVLHLALKEPLVR